MTRLNAMIASSIPNEEFDEKKRSYPVRFFNKEHLYYYEVYRKIIGEVPGPKEGEKACEGCGAGMEANRSHCRVCGWIEGGLS